MYHLKQKLKQRWTNKLEIKTVVVLYMYTRT